MSVETISVIDVAKNPGKHKPVFSKFSGALA
jgi:hypothetical protein